MNENPARPKRRWFCFRLRSLFILVTLCCLAIGWYAVRVLPQKRAVAAIRAAGGSCEYDYTDGIANAGPFDRYGKLHWLPDLFGDDMFYSVIGVGTPPSSDATLAHVGNLTNLNSLILYQGNFNEEGLQHLSRLRQLRFLRINGANITGQGFTAFVGLPHLQTLYLCQCNGLTAAGQRQIGQLEHLNDVTFEGCTSVTVDCLRPIVARGNLKSLAVGFCHHVDFAQLDLTPLCLQESLYVNSMTSAQLKQLTQLDQLKRLKISYCMSIPEDAFAELRGCHQLTELSLHAVTINDAGLECLAGMHKLNSLRLTNCPNVTQRGCAQLKAAHPRCTILFSPDGTAPTSVDPDAGDQP